MTDLFFNKITINEDVIKNVDPSLKSQNEEKSQNTIYDSYCFVISINQHPKELRNVLTILKEKFDRKKLPPIIIMDEMGVMQCSYPEKKRDENYTNIQAILKEFDLGIATVIHPLKLSGINPIGLNFWTANDTCDQAMDSWDKLTDAIHMLIQKGETYINHEKVDSLKFKNDSDRKEDENLIPKLKC